MKLQNIDPLDIEEVITKVEKSFAIEFEVNELKNVITFGDFFDAIRSKIKLQHVDSCTSQQIFYTLRSIICANFAIKTTEISPSSSLSAIFPEKIRIERLKSLGQQLGFNVSILGPPPIVSTFIIITLFSSMILLFITPLMGLLGFALLYIMLKLSDKYGKTFQIDSLKQLVKKIEREHYVESRRNKHTYNKNEIEAVVLDLFAQDLDLKKLTRTSLF